MKFVNLKAAFIVLELAIGCGAFAQIDPPISFATKESTERASCLLREKGILQRPVRAMQKFNVLTKGA